MIMKKQTLPAGKSVRDPYDALRPGSAITHGIGIALAVIGTVFLLFFAMGNDISYAGLVSYIIYGLALIGLYTASTVYHSANTREKGRILLRKTDHMMIYFLIAGTYTPLCVISLGNTFGYVLLAVIWSLAVIGSITNLFWINMPRWLTSAVYLFMGWLAVVAIYPLSKTIGIGLFWLLLGGGLYTIGGVLYAVKWPGRDNPRFGCHEIFHIFILLGSAAHYAMMFSLNM